MSINHQNVNPLRPTGNRKCREQRRRKIGSICVKYPKRCDQFALYYGHHFPCNLLSTKLLSRRFCCINFMSCCSVVYANSVHAVVIPSVWVPVTFAAMPNGRKIIRLSVYDGNINVVLCTPKSLRIPAVITSLRRIPPYRWQVISRNPELKMGPADAGVDSITVSVESVRRVTSRPLRCAQRWTLSVTNWCRQSG